MKYEYWLAAITPLSDRKKYLLRKHLGSGECIFYIEETKLKELEFLNERDIHTIRQAQKERNPGNREQSWRRNPSALFPVFPGNFQEGCGQFPIRPMRFT